MIPAVAVKRFLAQRRDDHRWLKDLKHAEVNKLLDELDPPPKFWHKLGLHQKVGLYLGIKYGCFAYWYDMGTGKTLVSLELLQYFWDCGLIRRALVFVTSDKAFPTWERQAKQYQTTFPFVSLDASSSERKWEILERSGPEGVICLTYPGTVVMVSKRVRVGKKKHKFELDPDLVDQLLENVDAVVWDESTKCANRQSLTYKVCLKASRQAEFRFALAGMPFGRDPTPLWPQMNLVDGGETLGKTLGLFREALFTAKDSFWGGPYSKDYTFKPRLKGKLSQMLQHRSLTYTAEECIDVPAVRRMLEEVRLPESTREYYRKVVEEIIEAKGNFRAMNNAFLRMRQLSSGFMGLKDDETGERAEIEFEQNPKLERLLELIEGLPEGRKALVFYVYTHSGRLITAELKALKLKPVWLWSGTKKPRDAMAQFIDDPKTTVAVINNQVGAYSLDGLQVANYEFHYETAVSVIDRSQAEKRIVRQGQKRKCFIYDLVVKDTVDEKILAFHQTGRDLFKSLLANPKAVLTSP